MRTFFILVGTIVTVFSTFGCTPALAANKVVSAETLYSPRPTIEHLSSPAKDDEATSVSPELLKLATPNLDLHKYVVPQSPPALTCPEGGKETKTLTANGWEVACLREGEKWGPYQALDKTRMVHVLAEYEHGKLHGAHTEISFSPEIRLVASVRDEPGPHVISFGTSAQVQHALDLGWPFVSLPDPNCPTGTTLARLPNKVACQLVDETDHGPQIKVDGGIVSFLNMLVGVSASNAAMLDDRRKARESVYEEGEIRRAFEHNQDGPLLLEVRKGEEATTLHFAAAREPLRRTSLYRAKKGKRNGVQLAWDAEGRLMTTTSYSDGVPHGFSTTWSRGKLTTVAYTEGTSSIHQRIGDNYEDRCRIENQVTTLCEQVVGGRLNYRATYHPNGRQQIKVYFSENGGKLDEEHFAENGLSTDKYKWNPDGKPLVEEHCNDKECETTQWDTNGKSTRKTRPSASASATDVDPLAAPLSKFGEVTGSVR